MQNFEQLIEWQLKEKHPKSWFRAFFNMGLINYIEGGRRMLPCEAGSANFLLNLMVMYIHVMVWKKNTG